MNVIKTSESITKISEALVEFQSKVKPIERKGYNNHQKYKYAKIENYIDSIKDNLKESGLFIMSTSGIPHRLESRKTERSIQYVVEIVVTTRIIHKSGEWVEVACYGEGQDSGDKAIYKAITGARKYALACLLNLSTTDDPENDEAEIKPTKNNYQKERNDFQLEPLLNKIRACQTLENLQDAFTEAWNAGKKNQPDLVLKELLDAKNSMKTKLASKIINQEKHDMHAPKINGELNHESI